MVQQSVFLIGLAVAKTVILVVISIVQHQTSYMFLGGKILHWRDVGMLAIVLLIWNFFVVVLLLDFGKVCYNYVSKRASTMMQWLALWPHCKEVRCLHASPCVCVGSLQILWLPPTVEKCAKLGVRLIGHSELPGDLNVNVDGRLVTCPGGQSLRPKAMKHCSTGFCIKVLVSILSQFSVFSRSYVITTYTSVYVMLCYDCRKQ